jgi:hypothetical protein
MGSALRGLLLVALILSGCAHRYEYSGTLKAPDSVGNVSQHFIYWNKTIRPLWYDSQEGSVRILPECSTNTLDYDEQPDGIIFRARPKDKHILEGLPDKHVCGRILHAKRIVDLPEGDIGVTVFCQDAPQDELDSPQPYLKAREQPYMFPVSRRKVPDFSEISKRPPCSR